ncbi:MAG TPA: hypothetical protein VJ792_05215 [Candidatus Nitrosotalea sp.]|nr:hypothetical protein [Candidatus Nitrosotalea sp.]
MIVHLRVHRGLGTIVTSAILLTTVAIIGASLVAWSNSNLSTFESALSSTTASDTNQINENLNFENFAFCSSCANNGKNVVNVTLTNTGSVPMNVTLIEVNKTALPSFYYSQSNPYISSSCFQVNGIPHTGSPSGPSTCLPAEIMPLKSYQVSASLTPNVWKSQAPDTITVITARGSIFTTQVAPP